MDKLLDQLPAFIIDTSSATVVATATATAVTAAPATATAATATGTTSLRLLLLDNLHLGGRFDRRLLGAFLNDFRRFSLLYHLELQSAFAGSVAESLHPAME